MFLSLFDVHVQRIPYQGTVQFTQYQPGSFAPAFLKDTRGNEYNYVGLATPRGPVGVKQNYRDTGAADCVPAHYR